MTDSVDVVVVGAGPAGLRAATDLARDHTVLLLERERQAGGIPRHSHHLGYGLRDLGRVISGPSYARAMVDRALAAGVQIRTSAMVTGWAGSRSLDVTSPTGRYRVEARAVLLATGARERPRPARWISGDRPAGVMTTGQLQQAVYLKRQNVGTSAVILGSELVSWSAVLTLREAGCRPIAMVTTAARPEAYALMGWAGRVAFRLPVLCDTTVVSINGHGRVSGITVRRGGRETTIACDTVITTGDWVPDHELARSRGIGIDASSKAPIVDTSLRLTDDGVFGAGNLLHPVDTADVCALDGAHAADSIRRWLAGESRNAQSVELRAGEGFAWVAPGQWCPQVAPARDRLLLWPTTFRSFPNIVVRQAGRVISRARVPWPAAPGRMFRLPSSQMAHVRMDDGPVEISIG